MGRKKVQPRDVEISDVVSFRGRLNLKTALKKGEPKMSLSIQRPSGSTRSHLERAYWMNRSRVEGVSRKKFGLPGGEKSLSRAAEFVESRKADPYEFVRILFLSCNGAYPYITQLGSEWAFKAYDETFGDGPSLALRVFIRETGRLSELVLSQSIPLDEALERGDFSPVSRVIHCSEEALPGFMEKYGPVAAERIKWDRDLRDYLEQNYGARTERNFQSGVAAEFSGTPVEVGPSKAPSRKRGNIPN